MLLMSILFTLLHAVQAVYLSTLVGPIQTIPGPPSTILSSIKTYDTDTGLVTTSTGYLGDPVSAVYPCLISTVVSEAPVATSLDSSAIYTICSAVQDRNPVKVLASGSILGAPVYQLLGVTTQFESTTVQRLATDNGTNFYILTRTEPGNSTVWWIRQGGDLTVIQNGTEDGWAVQSIQVSQGSLMGIGNRITNPLSRQVLWWGGRSLPTVQQAPQPYPGLLASNGNNLLGFTFSDPSTLWIVNGASAAGGSSMIMMYLYNKQTMTWTIGGYYMFNATQPTPNTVFIGGRAPISRFHGVTGNALVEYSIPPGGGSGTAYSALGARVLMSADRTTVFRGLAVSAWTPVPSPSTMATVTASPSASASLTMSVSASPSVERVVATATASASATASTTALSRYYISAQETYSASPTRSSDWSSTPHVSMSASASAKPTRSVGYSESNTASPTPTPSQTGSPTATLSQGASPSTTSTASLSPTPSSTSSFLNNTEAGIAAASDPDYGLKVGFGVAVPLLLVGVSGFVLFSLFKSGKLFTMFKPQPKYMRHGYGAKAPRAPMAKHPVMSQNPLASQTIQMNFNTKALDSIRKGQFSVRALEANQEVSQLEKPQTIVKTRVSFPQMQASMRSLGTSV